MTIHLELIPILSILAGALILYKPKFLSYIVGVYLIVIGLLEIFPISF